MNLFGRKASPTTLAARWLVVDCETSGLDPARDRLLSVGACVVQGGSIPAAERFSAVLQQDAPSHPQNILIHGIGAQEQLGAPPAKEVLREFARFLGDGVPVAFHSPFDAEILRREFARAKQAPLRGKWLDVAQLAPALFPDRALRRRTLDDWLEEFGIECRARHDALADAFATAQLLLVLLAEGSRQGLQTVNDVMDAARGRRWLAPGWGR